MSFDFGTVSTTQTEIRESPLIWIPGVDSRLTVQIDGTGTLASATMTLWENGRDVSAAVSGARLADSMSVSGRNITTKTFTSLVGGNVYRYYISFTDDGVAQVREGTIYCVKLGVNPSDFPSAINRLRISESPITVYPGQSYNGVITVDGEGVIGASPTMSIYKGTSDFSATALSSSLSVSGRAITLKTIGSLSGGFNYLVYVFFTDSGKNTCRYFEVICPKLGV
jgi:hypothetical protein